MTDNPKRALALFLAAAELPDLATRQQLLDSEAAK